MAPGQRPNTVDDFWRKVLITEDPWDCWLFQSKSKDWYGTFKLNGQEDRAHRIAFELSRGRPVAAGMLIRHGCDMPRCCNPCHLFEGTIADNIADRNRRGRTHKGNQYTRTNERAK